MFGGTQGSRTVFTGRMEIPETGRREREIVQREGEGRVGAPVK